MGKWRYGVILDAGSSGTRVYVYRWLNAAKARKGATKQQLHNLPALETDESWSKKIHPGVSSFGDTPDLVGPDHLKKLYKHALKHVPEDEVENTPVFLLATAGMRLLPPLKRKSLLREICTYTREHYKFQLPDCDLHIQVIPGETEGLYGWIAANYLLGGFDRPQEHSHGKGHHTYGFLDMGGASAQVAFVPNATETEKHANDLKLLRLRTLDGAPAEYRVFVTTWLEFGVHEARRRYLKALQEASPTAVELPDPCLPAGLNVTFEGAPIPSGSDEAAGKKPHLLGTGAFPECERKTYPLLDKDAPCPDAPCLFHGSHVPAIDFDVNHFVGISEYWHTTHEIFHMGHEDKAYDFSTYEKRVMEFCSQDWKTIQEGVKSGKWGGGVEEKTALEVCFKASWLINVLHNGIGVPRVGLGHVNGGPNGTKAVSATAKQKGFLDPFQAVDDINGVEVSWTLGKMVLYASSEVPPQPGTLAVGFGSNEAGRIPSDFQYPGGSFEMAEDLKEEEADWHDSLFHDSPRRIPGLLLFVLILLLAVFLLCGRDRRKSCYRRVRHVTGLGSSPSRRRRQGPTGLLGVGNKLFNIGPRQPSYERVLESGGGPSTEDFDLPELDSDNDHSDSSDGTGSVTRMGRSSGWATPQMKTGFDGQQVGYFDNIVAQGQGLGLGPPSVHGGSVMGRAGLMSRTESRERLGVPAPGGGSGRRSRTGSPSRVRSPLMMSSSLKET